MSGWHVPDNGANTEAINQMFYRGVLHCSIVLHAPRERESAKRSYVPQNGLEQLKIKRCSRNTNNTYSAVPKAFFEFY